MKDPSSHLAIFVETIILRNDKSLDKLSPTDGKYFYSIITDNVLAFSSYRTMSIDQNVYITVINFNMHRTTIDIDEQFYPISSTAEILINSTPTRWTNHSDDTSVIKSMSTNS